MQWVAQHRKLIVSVIGAVITVAIQVWGTGSPWVSAVVLIATAAGVYRAPNEDPVAAPAGTPLPGTPAGGGLEPTGTVTIIPDPPPQPVQERVAMPPQGTGVTGTPPSGYPAA